GNPVFGDVLNDPGIDSLIASISKEKGSSQMMKWFLTGLSCLNGIHFFGVKNGLNWKTACLIPHRFPSSLL
mgnify:CR=1